MLISILGAGSWGSALAIAMSHVAKVNLWSKNQAQVRQINLHHNNPGYLPATITFPSNVWATTDLSQVLASDLLIIATPVKALPQLLNQLMAVTPALDNDLLWVCKGFHEDTGHLPHQMILQVRPAKNNLGALLGPSFALEVAKGLPTAVTLASTSIPFSNKWLAVFKDMPNFRVYANADLIGAEVGAGVKNIIAIAVGIADGLDLGYNARAGLITRSISELKPLVIALGGRVETLYGLTGLGDLILTCTGSLSRNRQVGLELAKGQNISDILAKLGHVAEGVIATKAAFNLAKQLKIAMPIVEAVYEIIYARADLHEQLAKLLGRELKFE